MMVNHQHDYSHYWSTIWSTINIHQPTIKWPPTIHHIDQPSTSINLHYWLDHRQLVRRWTWSKTRHGALWHGDRGSLGGAAVVRALCEGASVVIEWLIPVVSWWLTLVSAATTGGSWWLTLWQIRAAWWCSMVANDGQRSRNGTTAAYFSVAGTWSQSVFPKCPAIWNPSIVYLVGGFNHDFIFPKYLGWSIGGWLTYGCFSK